MSTGPATKKTGIFALTEGGARLAASLAEKLVDTRAVHVHIPLRLIGCKINCVPPVGLEYFKDWREVFVSAFRHYDEMICIMATGIVVRTVAAYLNSKFTDPAVVVLDEKGDYAISLLSGHLGGANELARYIAARLGGHPVITTATDINGKPAVDLLADKLKATFAPVEYLKFFNRALAEGQELLVTSPFPIKPELWRGLTWLEWSDWLLTKKAGRSDKPFDLVVIGPYKFSPELVKSNRAVRVMQLFPRNLVVGLGCRRGVALDDIEAAYNAVLKKFSIAPECVSSLATIDFKKSEEGLRLLSQKLKIPLKTVSKHEIKALEGTYKPSNWVEKTIGVGGVCEPAARLVAKMGITLVPKQKVDSVTISVAMEKSWWLD